MYKLNCLIIFYDISVKNMKQKYFLDIILHSNSNKQQTKRKQKTAMLKIFFHFK